MDVSLAANVPCAVGRQLVGDITGGIVNNANQSSHIGE